MSFFDSPASLIFWLVLMAAGSLMLVSRRMVAGYALFGLAFVMPIMVAGVGAFDPDPATGAITFSIGAVGFTINFAFFMMSLAAAKLIAARARRKQ